MKDEDRIYAVFSYFIPFFGGIIVYLLRKSAFERFHAVQSLLFWGTALAISVGLNIIDALLNFIPLIGKIIGILINAVSIIFGLAVLALWVVLMLKAYEKERFKLPVLGELAEKNSR